MDPVSVVLAALATGAAAGVAGAATDTVKSMAADAYAGLRRMVTGLFSGDEKAEAKADKALELFEQDTQDPDAVALVGRLLQSRGVREDDPLVLAARELLAASGNPHTDPDSAAGTVAQLWADHGSLAAGRDLHVGGSVVTGGQGVQIGDRSIQHNRF